MTIVGAYIGGNPPELAAGRSGLSLCITTTDRLNQDTASWTITATGFSETVDADETGRAYVELPSGPTYNVVLNHEGNYQNDLPQSFKAESRKHYGVYFDLFTYPEINTMLKVITRPKTTVTITSGSNSMTAVADANGYAYFNGLPVDSTWNITIRGESKDITIHDLYSEIEVGNYYLYGIKINLTEADPESACTYTDDAIGITPASGHNMNGWAGSPIFDAFRPVVISNKTKQYLDKRDLTKTVSGGSSNIDVVGNDAMVEVPVMYTYWQNDGEYVTIKYCNKKLEGFYAYAHTQSGQLQTHFYWACFLANVVSEKMYSTCDSTPISAQDFVAIGDFITYARARGEGYDVTTWFQCIFMVGIVLLAYKTRNIRGQIRGSSSKSSNTTSIFDNDYGISGSSSNMRMSFLWIWDFWGGMAQFIGRAKISDTGKLMVIMDGYSSKDTGFETTDIEITEGSGYISNIEGSPIAGFLPKSYSGSLTTYWCTMGCTEYGSVPTFGYHKETSIYTSPFALTFRYGFSSGSSYFGSRLAYCLGIS